MNRKWYMTVLTIFALAASCAKSNEVAFQLPDGIFTIVNVYDIANSNTFADVRVDISVIPSINTADISEVRLIFAKASTTFSQDQITSLAGGNFYLIPTSSQPTQVIKPASFKDSDGSPISNNVPYKIYIGVIGKQGSRQLSTAKEFTLKDKPVYAGDYVGTWEDLGPPGPGKFAITLRVADDYSAQLFYTGNFVPYGKAPAVQDVTATVTISGNRFSFNATQRIEKYLGGGLFSSGSGGGCPAAKLLAGTIQDDINLIFDKFNWSDCDGTRDVNMKFTKN